MTPCAAATGFFLLAPCGVAAVTGCANCGRPLCARHAGADGRCVACTAAPADDIYAEDYADALRRRAYRPDYLGYPDWYAGMTAADRAPFDPRYRAHPGYDADDTEYLDS